MRQPQRRGGGGPQTGLQQHQHHRPGEHRRTPRHAATFGREIINREVHDSADDILGSVTDFTIDFESGQITNILVMIEPDINPQLLPWPTVNGLLSVPVEEIDSVGKVIKLSE